MNRKNHWKWACLGLGSLTIVSGVAGASVVLSSCSSNNNQATPFGTKNYVSFNAEINKAETKSTELQQPTKTIDLDPATNINSINLFKSMLQKLAVKSMQYEFDNGLLQFFQANEFESNGADFDTEAEIKDIKVTNVKYVAPNATLPTPGTQQKVTPSPQELYGTIIVNADVTYDVEIEQETRDNEINKSVVQSKEITLIPQLAGKNELNEIIKQLTQVSTDNTKIPEEILDELKEIYFGDNDDDDSNDFDLEDLFDTESNEWENKGGVLNFLNNFINNVSPYAKMAGWNINLSQVSYTPNPGSITKVANPLESIWAPSSAISTILYPTLGSNGDSTTNIGSVNGTIDNDEIDLSINMSALSKTTLSQWFENVFQTNQPDNTTGTQGQPGSISTWTDATKISNILTNLKTNSGITIPNSNVISIIVDTTDFNDDGEIELKIINSTIEYELDIQTSWFKQSNMN